MGQLLMQGLIFFVLLELAHCQNGSMTISSSRYYVNTSQHTTKSIKNGMDISLQMVAGYKMVVGSGSKEKPCWMGMSWSLTKMSAPFSEIFQREARFTYNDADIDHLSKVLGIPWENSKTIPFLHTVLYLGFTWDIQV